MGRVKGGKISSKIAFIREYYGEEMIQKIVASMTPRDQAELKLILDTAWYSIDLYDRFVVAICDVAASGDSSVYEKIGFHSADLAFSTTYKTFRGKNPTDLFEKTLSMHAMRNDPAEMKVISQQDGACIVRIAQPRSTVALCSLARAFYVRAIELCGQSNVRVRETSCSGRHEAYCQFEIAWQ
ncbi:MAG TPA: hypothetical protein VKM94_05240 [Blastocatellia bacterium]|nr:hypothetical protein [Blastocatellia bacterium]